MYLLAYSYKGVVAASCIGSYIVEFDVPAYLGLYPSFLVVFPYQAWRPVAFHKQLAATTNNIGNFTSSFKYFIVGLAHVPVCPPAVCIRVPF